MVMIHICGNTNRQTEFSKLAHNKRHNLASKTLDMPKFPKQALGTKPMTKIFFQNCS